MNNILEEFNRILKNGPMNIEELKSKMLIEFNNKILIDIVIKKGIKEGKLEIDKNNIRLLNEFEHKKEESETCLCISIPPFEKTAIDTILNTQIVNINTIEHAFISLIKNSEKTIKICSPFLQLDGWVRLEKYFIEFLKKGGKIKIICRGISESKKRQWEIRTIIKAMENLGLDRNIEFREYHFFRTNIESSSHAKLFISDDKEAYIGSGEIRKNSFDLNFEMGILVKGEIVKDIEKLFDFMYKSSKKIDLQNGKRN